MKITIDVQNRSFEFNRIDNENYHALIAWEKIETDGEIRFLVETGNSSQWKKYELEFVASSTDYSGRLALTVAGRGKVYLDFVSLFPKDTYKGRRNGLRKDIAEKLADLNRTLCDFLVDA